MMIARVADFSLSVSRDWSLCHGHAPLTTDEQGKALQHGSQCRWFRFASVVRARVDLPPCAEQVTQIAVPATQNPGTNATSSVIVDYAPIEFTNLALGVYAPSFIVLFARCEGTSSATYNADIARRLAMTCTKHVSSQIAARHPVRRMRQPMIAASIIKLQLRRLVLHVRPCVATR